MKTGFKELDKRIEIEGAKLIILGSRPAMGKSTLALNILSNIAIRENKAVLYFNLESCKKEIETRFIVSNAMIEYEKVKKAEQPDIAKYELTEEESDRIEYGKELLKSSKIFIDDRAAIPISKICEKARKYKINKNIELMVIDYLQLIRYDGEECLARGKQIIEILKSLKELSEELNIPILVVSQLLRPQKERENQKPIITDFYESGGITTQTDIVLLLHREEENAEIIIAKNNLETDNIEIAWMPEYIKFGNLLKIK